MLFPEEAGMLLLMLGGCDIIELIMNVQETVEDLTNPVIIQSTFIGVGAPPPDVAFPEDAEIGPLIKAYLADTTRSSDLADSPVSGAMAMIQVGNADPIMMPEGGGGDEPPGYSAGVEQGLEYVVGAQALLTIETDDILASATWPLPDGLDFDIPCRVDLLEDLIVVMDGPDYHSPLVTVLNEEGVITWSNFPKDIDAAVDWVNGGGFATVEVPGAQAFSEAGLHIIGIAPMQRANSGSFEGANISLSAYMLGQMRFWATYAGPIGDSGLPELPDTACP
jgi:hypothetical protein